MPSTRLFDKNGKFVTNFDDVIDDIEKNVHGDNYYDEDRVPDDTRLIPLNNIVDQKCEALEIKNQKIKKIVKKKVTFKDFVPLLFFILIFLVIVFAGYYFLNSFDFSKFM